MKNVIKNPIFNKNQAEIKDYGIVLELCRKNKVMYPIIHIKKWKNSI